MFGYVTFNVKYYILGQMFYKKSGERKALLFSMKLQILNLHQIIKRGKDENCMGWHFSIQN